MNSIICGDNARVMAGFPDDYIDLTVTSPPYDNLRTYNGHAEFDFEAVARQLYRVTKSGGVVVWVVGDATINGSETGTSFRQALYFMGCGFNLHDTMIYEKNSPAAPDSTRYFQIYEFMFILSKGRPASINLIEDRKNRWAGSFGKRTMRDKNGELVSKGKFVQTSEFGVRNNIWRYNTGKGYSASDDIAYEHPAIFPETLANDHILSWSNPGDLVLDCFAGSGTTLKKAKELGRRYIGIDSGFEYCQLARKRLLATNPPLFV